MVLSDSYGENQTIRPSPLGPGRPTAPKKAVETLEGGTQAEERAETHSIACGPDLVEEDADAEEPAEEHAEERDQVGKLSLEEDELDELDDDVSGDSGPGLAEYLHNLTTWEGQRIADPQHVLTGVLMAAKMHISGKRLLQLRSGSGLAGFTAHKLGALQVTLSDQSRKAVEQLNVIARAANQATQWAANTGGPVPSVRVALLREVEDDYDVVVCTELPPQEAAAPALAAILHAKLSPQDSSRGIVLSTAKGGSHDHITRLEAFTVAARKQGLGFRVVPLEVGSSAPFTTVVHPASASVTPLLQAMTGEGMVYRMEKTEELAYWKSIAEKKAPVLACICARVPDDI